MNLPRPLACSLADTLRRGFRLDVDARFRPLGGDHYADIVAAGIS
jgi:hypothetical protein